MKKNHSFRATFYMGLFVILVVFGVLSLIVLNVFWAVSPKLRHEKSVETIQNYEMELDSDTDKKPDTVKIYIEKPVSKPVDTPKNNTSVKPKVVAPVIEKQDTTSVSDSTN